MPSTERKVPNFFIIGAPKSGTTSLYYYLNQHPDVYMSPLKETSYFSEEARPENFAEALQPGVRRDLVSMRRYLDSGQLKPRFGGMVTEWEDYCRLFAGARGERAIGEATTCYLWSKTAAPGIAARFPDAKIVMLLRDPANRAFSQYLHAIFDGLLHCGFREYMRAAEDRCDEGKLSVFYPFLDMGLYSDQVSRYRQCFPPGQLGIWLYEDTRSPNFLRDVFKFLEVSPDFEVDRTKRHMQAQIPRSLRVNSALQSLGIRQTLQATIPRPLRASLRNLFYRNRDSIQMQPAEREMLVEYYREDILKLEGLLQRDLSAWRS
jgi:hypothetical protein